MKHLDLFSGIGGFSLGLERTGFFKTVAFCEKDEFCKKVLRKHWLEVPIYDEIKGLGYKLSDDGIRADVVTGGFPCQPFSVAGKQRGVEDDRYLWKEMLAVIIQQRPTWVIGENVAGIVNMALDEVLSDLEAEGYATRAFIIPACAVDAPHRRNRVWIIAHANSNRKSTEPVDGKKAQGELGIMAYADISVLQSRSHGQGQEQPWRACGWETDPAVGRVAHGVPRRVDRLRSLGNAVVPQIVTQIGYAISKFEREESQ